MVSGGKYVWQQGCRSRLPKTLLEERVECLYHTLQMTTSHFKRIQATSENEEEEEEEKCLCSCL